VENNEMDNQDLKENDEEEDDHATPPAPQPKYPNNLEQLRKKRKLSPAQVIYRMNDILEQDLVVGNYTGWEEGEHLPNEARRDALAKVLEVKSETDIWPTLYQILEQQRERRRTAAGKLTEELTVFVPKGGKFH
jgi:DNA-binding transcriptional regulator YiaG